MSSSTKPRRNILLVIIGLSIIILSITSLYLNRNNTQVITETITVGFFKSEFNALIYVAEEQNYFEANGLNVIVKNYNTGSAATTGLLNGEVDITGASEYVLAEKALQNEDIVTFGSYCKSNKFYLVARGDVGINSIQDLTNKTIGTPLKTNGEFYLGRFLQLNRIELTDVKIVNITPFIDTPKALAAGTVDAAVVFQPYINEIDSLLGNTTRKWPIQGGQLAYIDAICKEEWAKEHPELIERFLKALIQAEGYTTSNPQKAKEIISKTLNYDVTYLDTVWDDYRFALSLDQSQIVAMEDQASWMIENKLTNETKVPDFLDYVDTAALIKLKPLSVNIIH